MFLGRQVCGQACLRRLTGSSCVPRVCWGAVSGRAGLHRCRRLQYLQDHQFITRARAPRLGGGCRRRYGRGSRERERTRERASENERERERELFIEDETEHLVTLADLSSDRGREPQTRGLMISHQLDTTRVCCTCFSHGVHVLYTRILACHQPPRTREGMPDRA